MQKNKCRKGFKQSLILVFLILTIMPNPDRIRRMLQALKCQMTLLDSGVWFQHVRHMKVLYASVHTLSTFQIILKNIQRPAFPSALNPEFCGTQREGHDVFAMMRSDPTNFWLSMGENS